nr:hypothetical protein [uncultured bacterium]
MMGLRVRTPMRSAAVGLVLLLVWSAPLVWGSPTAAWEELPPMTGARAEATAATVGSHIYVIGGVMEDFLPVVSGTEGRVDVYDIETEEWQPGPPLPLAVNHATAVAVGTKIYVIGGYIGSLLFTPVATTWVLDTSVPLDEQAWAPFVPLPAARAAHAAVTDGQTIWVFGGIGEPGAISIGVPEAFHERTVLALDLEADVPAWQVLGLFPDVRDHLVGAYHDGKVYAIGGRDLQVQLITGRMDVLDVATGTWSVGPSLPTARGGAGAAVINGSIYVVGGETTTHAFADAEAYDTALGTWSVLPPMPGPRHGVGVVAVDGSLYVEGGGPAPGYAFSATNFRLLA